jgi:hypothetical protein
VVGKALALLLTVAGVALGAAPTVAARGAEPPSASLGPLVCRPATSALSRMIEVTATMRPVPGTERMQLRFVLLERIPGYAFRPVRGGDLGRWLHEPPATGGGPVTAWIVKKPVVNLYAPADYRFRVSFRWIGTESVIATSARVSPVCEQPEYASASRLD